MAIIQISAEMQQVMVGDVYVNKRDKIKVMGL